MSDKTASAEIDDGMASQARARMIACAAGVASVIVVGMILNAAKPIWLTPPLSRTLVIYIVLGLIWIPALVVAFVVWPKTRRRMFLAFAVVSVIMGVLGFLVTVSGRTNLWLLADDSYNCIEQRLPPTSKYTCGLSIFTGEFTYTFEGPMGWPFMRLISVDLSGS